MTESEKFEISKLLSDYFPQAAPALITHTVKKLADFTRADCLGSIDEYRDKSKWLEPGDLIGLIRAKTTQRSSREKLAAENAAYQQRRKEQMDFEAAQDAERSRLQDEISKIDSARIELLRDKAIMAHPDLDGVLKRLNPMRSMLLMRMILEQESA